MLCLALTLGFEHQFRGPKAKKGGLILVDFLTHTFMCLHTHTHTHIRFGGKYRTKVINYVFFTLFYGYDYNYMNNNYNCFDCTYIVK